MSERQDPSQGNLFADETLRLLTDGGSPDVVLPPAPSAPPWEQLDLFAEPTFLRTAIERAIAAAEFGEAVELRESLLRDHGASWLSEDTSFLDELAECCWHPPHPDAIIGAWHDAARRIQSADRHRQVADALFVRLARSVAPSTIAALDRCCLPEIVGALWRQGSDDVARSLVRDALLAGRDLAPAAFDHPRVRDVLIEDFAPERLAVVGALRHAWPAPRASDEDVPTVRATLGTPAPDGDGERALAFWHCMRVAELRGRLSDDLLLEVRKRMRMLDPELHALYMERLT